MATEKHIGFVKFSELKNWDVKKFIDSAELFNNTFKIAFFEEFSKPPEIEKIHIKDDDEYKILGVRSYGYGAFVNRIVKGKSLKMKVYQQAKPNHLYWCKVDTKNGAFGIITEDLADGIASSNMTFANLDINKINPEYVQILFRSKKFNEYMDSFVTGTTNRKYIRPSQLYDEIQIPLPPLNDADAIKQGLPTDITQEKLVAEYNQKIKEAEQAKQNAIKKEAEIETYLYQELGIQKAEKKEAKKGLHFVRFKDMARWDSEYLLTELIELNSDFPLVSYNNLFIDLYNGIPARHYSTEGVRFLKVADIRPNHISNHNIKHINSYKKSDLITENTLLITRKGTVGNSIFIKENNKYTASSEVFIIKLDTQKVNGDYLSIINNSEFVQNQYREKNTGTIMPSISQNKLKEIKIPLPKSLEKQNDIVEKVSLIERTAKNYLDLSETLKTNAIKDFENIIFKANNEE